MDYRREIDGLRALAVLAVILCHAQFQYFKGGFIGVDVFFVISGYLITTIIVSEQQSNKFSLVNFYEKRVRRILPSLYFVMAVCIPFAWILCPIKELVSFSKSLAAAALMLANIYFGQDVDYFSEASELKPLLHTWSLAVEEQYYIFFPILLVFALRLRRLWVIALITIISILSLSASQWGAYHSPTENFFSLLTRIWEIGIGALIAFYLISKPSISVKARDVLSVLGIVMIASCTYLFSNATPNPSFFTLLPTIGASLVIVFANHKTKVGQILGSRPFVAIGILSYGAYLWHQPLFAFARSLFGELGGYPMFGLVIGSFTLAFLTWKWIDLPLRVEKNFSRNSIFFSAAIFALFLSGFGWASAKFLDNDSETMMARALSEYPAIFASNMDERQFMRQRIKFEEMTPKVIVIGSSRAMLVGNKNLKFDTLNLAVSGASMEDHIAILGMAREKFQPETIFIGVDPWLLNANSGQHRWESLREEYKKALLSIDSNQNDDSNISIEAPLTFMESQKDFIRNILNKFYLRINANRMWSDNDKPEIRGKILKDGTRVYSADAYKVNQSEIEKQFGVLINYSMQDYLFSPANERIFNHLLQNIQGKSNVVLVLSPYHPKLYQRIKNERKFFLDIEAKFRDLARVNGIKIIGSYDPGNVGCDDGEFFDGMHPRETCVSKLLSELGPTLK